LLPLGPDICRLVESQADPQPMLMHTRWFPLPPEHVTVIVAVVLTTVPGRTLTVPNATLVMLTVQACANTCVGMSRANRPSPPPVIRPASVRRLIGRSHIEKAGFRRGNNQLSKCSMINSGLTIPV
jgi:hypothetical protein